jgi:uncharacterized membrane protein YuzA (DUF378 family)
MNELLSAIVIVWTLFTYLMYILWGLAAIFVIALIVRAYINSRADDTSN